MIHGLKQDSRNRSARALIVVALLVAASTYLFVGGGTARIGTEANVSLPAGYPAVTRREPGRYIVRADSAAAAARLVADAGGDVLTRIELIGAVGARLDGAALDRVQAHPRLVAVYADAELEVLGSGAPTHYPEQVGAPDLHAMGITGDGVTVAVLDTGLWETAAIANDSNGKRRVRATVDTILQIVCEDEDEDDDEYGTADDCDEEDDADHSERFVLDDWNGHGTHVTSIIASSGRSPDGRFNGIAPDVGIVALRAFEPDGSGRYLDVLEALDWIARNRKRHDIRVLNLSFGARADSHYWNDPINLAVMAIWRLGIVVVTSAGNGGPGPMTVSLPGNVPYVVTVGAATDSFTPDLPADDRLATFSAAGPTAEGFVKPDVVAPGGHMLGLMPFYAWLPLQYPEHVVKYGNAFRMSGTSQAAAVVSGIVALMLQDDPSLSPDDVKCRLMTSARPALDANGEFAYSVFQQGAGLVDALAAVTSDARGCANQDLSLLADLFGFRHYAGPAGVDASGTYYLVDENGTRRSGPAWEWELGSLAGGAADWGGGHIWHSGNLWGESVAWTRAGELNGDSLMTSGALWPDGNLWGEVNLRQVATYIWVGQE